MVRRHRRHKRATPIDRRQALLEKVVAVAARRRRDMCTFMPVEYSYSLVTRSIYMRSAIVSRCHTLHEKTLSRIQHPRDGSTPRYAHR